MEYRITSLILCGGKGSRLKKLGEKTPKSLIKIAGKPFIEYIFSSLNEKSINKIIVSGYYKFNILKNKLVKMRIKNLEISNDGDISILERVKKNLTKEKCSLLVCYGDEYANINIKQLLKSHFSSKKLLTITTKTLKSNFGFLKY